MTTIKNIVREWLTARGYDGLCAGECGCGIDDLIPCGQMIAGYCQPARRKVATEADSEFASVGNIIYVPAESEEA